MESKLGNVSIMLEQDAGEETDNLEASIRRVEINELLMAKIRSLQADDSNAEQFRTMEHLIPLTITSLSSLRDSQEPNANKARREARAAFRPPNATQHDFECFLKVEKIIDCLMDAVAPLPLRHHVGATQVDSTSTDSIPSSLQPLPLPGDKPKSSCNLPAARAVHLVDSPIITIDDHDLPEQADDEILIVSEKICSPSNTAARSVRTQGGRQPVQRWIAEMLDFSNEPQTDEDVEEISTPSTSRDHGSGDRHERSNWRGDRLAGSSRKRHWQVERRTEERECRDRRRPSPKRIRGHHRNSNDHDRHDGRSYHSASSIDSERQQSSARDASRLSRVDREEYRTNSGTSLAGFPSSGAVHNQGPSTSGNAGETHRRSCDGRRSTHGSSDHVVEPAKASEAADTCNDEVLVLREGRRMVENDAAAAPNAAVATTETQTIILTADLLSEVRDEHANAFPININLPPTTEAPETQAVQPKLDDGLSTLDNNGTTDQEVPVTSQINEENPATNGDELCLNESETSTQARRVSISLETSSLVFEIEEGNELKPLNGDVEEGEASAKEPAKPVKYTMARPEKLPLPLNADTAAIKRYVANHLKQLLSMAAKARAGMRRPSWSRWMLTDSVLARLNKKLLSNTFVTHLPNPILPEWLLDFGLSNVAKFDFECSYLFIAFGWDSWRLKSQLGTADSTRHLEFIHKLTQWFVECSRPSNPSVVERTKYVETYEEPPKTVAVRLKYGLQPPVFVLVTMPEVGEETALRHEYNCILRTKAVELRKAPLSAMVEILDWAELVKQGTTNAECQLDVTMKILVEELRLTYGVLLA